MRRDFQSGFSLMLDYYALFWTIKIQIKLQLIMLLGMSV